MIKLNCGDAWPHRDGNGTKLNSNNSRIILSFVCCFGWRLLSNDERTPNVFRWILERVTHTHTRCSSSSSYTACAPCVILCVSDVHSKLIFPHSMRPLAPCHHSQSHLHGNDRQTIYCVSIGVQPSSSQPPLPKKFPKRPKRTKRKQMNELQMSNS